jgi:hypothetical protein
VWNRTTSSLVEILYGFSYTLAHEADVDVTKPLGQRVKFRVTGIPPWCNELPKPYTRIDPAAFAQRGANSDGVFQYVPRRG